MLRVASLLVLALCATAAPAAAQGHVRVGATLSASAVRVGDAVTLEITVSTPDSEPDAISDPRLPDGLAVVGSSDFSEYRFSLPGGRKRLTRRQIAITAQAPGEYRIPPLAVRVDGAIYRTKPLTLRVLDAAGGYGSAVTGFAGVPSMPAPPPAASRSLVGGPGDEVLLQSWVSPDTVYVGQQVTLHTDALISDEVRGRLAAAPQYQAPSLGGFWTYDVRDDDALDFRNFRGRLFEVQSFERAFFPLAAGSFSLPGSQLAYSVRRGFLGGSETRQLQGDSLPVVVRPLPAAGRPAGFDGAVGRYAIRAHLAPTRVGAGEAATLVVEVSGEGNIKAVPPPRLPALDGVQVFPPTEDTDVQTTSAVVQGSKRFSWVLVPSRAGTLTVPPIQLPYFDPARRSYDVARADPLVLRVGPGGDAVARAPVTPIGPGAEGPVLQPLRTRASDTTGLGWVHSPAFAALQLVPLFAFLGVLLTRRRARPGRQARRGAERRQWQERWAAVRGAAASGNEHALAETLALARQAVAARAGAPALTAPADALAPMLRDAGVPDSTAQAVAASIGGLEQARYAPVRPDVAGWERRIAELERLLKGVDGGEGSGHGVGGAAALVLLLAAIPVHAASAAPARAKHGAFEQGVVAYHNGDWERAAERFHAAVRENPENAAAWYDLGNASSHAGRRGDAAWAWLRALRLEPRNGAARHNLVATGVDAALLSGALPPLPLSGDELLLLASLLWLGCGTALALSWRSRRAGPRAVAAAGVLGAALLVATAGFGARPSTVAVVRDDSAALLAAPNRQAERRVVLRGGTGVRLVAQQGDWVRARAGGEEGWIEARALGRL